MGEETAAPRVVGRYEVLREVGRGGMAIVHLANQPDLGRHVALKELSRFHASSPEFAHRFLRESQLAGSLNHPNIVTVYEYFEYENIPYIAMEFVPRGSLRSYTKRLTFAQIAGVLEGVLAGLTHAEQAGIVHRDLKPENIMVTADGRVKIADFGIARATQRAGRSFVTASGITVGTPSYMSPEQAMAGDIGPWTDLYSVGVVAYELVVGEVPFHDTDAAVVILMRHVNEEIPSARSVRPDVNQALSDWIDRLLVKDPKQRTQTANDAWEQLEEIVVGELGPLWRRGARLLDDQRAAEGSRPLTPAPFESQPKLPTPASTPATPEPDAGPEDADPAGVQPVSPVQPSGFVTFDPGRGALRQPRPPAAPAEQTPVLEPTPERPEPTPVLEPTPAGPSPTGDETLAPAPELAVGPELEPGPEPEQELWTEPESEPWAEAAPESQAVAVAATSRARRPSPRVMLAGAGLLAVAAAAVVGFVAAPTANKSVTTTVPLSQHAAAGPLRVTYPSGWAKTPTVPAPAKSLRLDDPVSLSASASNPAGNLVIGTGASHTQSLLPGSFVHAARSLPPPTYVKLGGTKFKRYLNVLTRGSSRPVSVYVLPTSKGIAIAACVDPQASATVFAATCERAVGTLTTRASKLAFGADPKYAHGVSADLKRLNSERAKIGKQLSAAKTPNAQAAADARLAKAYAAGARRVAKSKPGPIATVANSAIVSALERLGNAYTKLSKAASKQDKTAYRAASRQVRAGVTALNRALAELRRAGYRVS